MIRYCIIMSFNTINALIRSQRYFKNNPAMTEKAKYFFILPTASYLFIGSLSMTKRINLSKKQSLIFVRILHV